MGYFEYIVIDFIVPDDLILSGFSNQSVLINPDLDIQYKVYNLRDNTYSILSLDELHNLSKTSCVYGYKPYDINFDVLDYNYDKEEYNCIVVKTPLIYKLVGLITNAKELNSKPKNVLNKSISCNLYYNGICQGLTYPSLIENIFSYITDINECKSSRFCLKCDLYYYVFDLNLDALNNIKLTKCKTLLMNSVHNNKLEYRLPLSSVIKKEVKHNVLYLRSFSYINEELISLSCDLLNGYSHNGIKFLKGYTLEDYVGICIDTYVEDFLHSLLDEYDKMFVILTDDSDYDEAVDFTDEEAGELCDESLNAIMGFDKDSDAFDNTKLILNSATNYIEVNGSDNINRRNSCSLSELKIEEIANVSAAFREYYDWRRKNEL